MTKERAIIDLNVPNGSRDIWFQSQESEQDGRRNFSHFFVFQPQFHLNMTSQTQSYKTMKKWKCNTQVQYLKSLLFDLFETFQAVKS